MKSSIFSNIDTKKNIITLQQQEDSMVEVKKRGRPPRPNMVKKLIKVDKVLYQQISELAQKKGTSIAYLLSLGIRQVLNDHKNKY